MAFDPTGRFGRFVARSGRPPGRPRALARRDATGIPVSVLPPGGRQGAGAARLPAWGHDVGARSGSASHRPVLIASLLNASPEGGSE